MSGGVQNATGGVDDSGSPRVLLIRPSALGDVCRSVPVAASVARAWPGARIDWLVQRGFEAAVREHPAVSGVVSFPRKDVGLARLVRSGAARGQLRGVLSALRPGPGYDVVIDAQGLARSAVFSWWTRAGRRVGERSAREGAWLAYTDRVDVPRGAHAVDRMLALLGPLGIEPVADMRLYTSEAHRAWASERVGSERYAVVAPTSRWAAKRWPIERFTEVVKAMLDDSVGVERVVVVAAGSEREQCAALLDRYRGDDRVVDLVGATGVGELMAVIEGASIVLANDSAALHMAVGFDRALVGLFGPTRVSRVGPYGREADVIQAAEPGVGMSHKDDSGVELMRAITVDDVVSAVCERLERTRASVAGGAA